MNGENWATWKFVNALALDPLATGVVFSAPPGKVDPFKDDTDARLALFSATTDVYRESALSLMQPPSHEQPMYMQAVAQRGGKLITFHGTSDPVFSAEDTRAWIERVRQIPGASDAVRYFPVPGMNHCSGGPASDPFDLLGPLVKWVEEGVAPQAITPAFEGPATPVARTRNCRPTGLSPAPARFAPTRRWPPTTAAETLKTPPASPAAEPRMP